MYVSDGNRVRKISPNGIIVNFAGTGGSSGYTGDGGVATSARLNAPFGLATDTAGNVYIADALNNAVRKVSPDGIIVTVAGTGTAGFSGDGGSAVAAQFNFPLGVATDSNGNLYVSDTSNSVIRKITGGVVTSYLHVYLRTLSSTALVISTPGTPMANY